MSDFFTVVPGVSAIDRVVNQPFTMGITAATPGDLSVSIAANTCRYDKLFEFLDVSIRLTFTPTYTTAAGVIVFTGLPFAADADDALSLIPMGPSSSFVWGGSGTVIYLQPQPNSATAQLTAHKSGATSVATPITAFVSGTGYTLRFRGRYRTARV